MNIYVSDIKNSSLNLIYELFLIDNFQENAFVVWTNNKGIYVGKNQNVIEEINYDFVKEEQLEIFRRLSGGGTIFHDQNTVYYSFIMKNDSGRTVPENFKYYNTIMADFFQSININVELIGRNDLLIKGRKVGGTAEHYRQGIMVHHGSLLFDTDIEYLAQSITPNKKKFISKAINSVVSRVDNISNHTEMTIAEFQNKLVDYMKKKYDGTICPIASNFKAEDYAYYLSEQWNFGKSPKYSYQKEEKYPFGLVKVKMNIAEGKIKEMAITGDFFSSEDIAELEKKFIGKAYLKNILEKILADIELGAFIAGSSDENLINLMWE